jgi:hypothetical protein
VFKANKTTTGVLLLSHEGDDISECLEVGRNAFTS